MELRTVELYREYGQERQSGQRGTLRCWAAATPSTVSPCRRRPAALILPGGGYEHLSQRESEPVALRFAARGWAAFVLEYSVAPARFPVPLQEAALAMRYIRQHAGELEIDPGMVAVVGFSAGGHLAGLLGTIWDDPQLADLAGGVSLRPDALGLCYPVAVAWGRTHQGSFDNLTGNDPELAGALSLDKLVRGDMPPVFLWATRNDGSVPCRNSLILAQSLEEAGVDFSLHLYRRGKHGLATADAMAFPTGAMPEMSWDVPGWMDAMMAFFRDVGLEIRDE